MNQRKNLETAMRLGAPATEPDQDWQEAGCSRSCRDGHNRRWGACAYGVEPAPTLARFETGLASDGYVSGGYVSMTTEQIAEWLREQGYTVASQAPQGPQEPTGRHGAGEGREEGGEGPWALRATAKRRILEALDRWHEVGLFETSGEFAGVMEAVDEYAAAIRQAEFEHTMTAVLDQLKPLRDPTDPAVRAALEQIDLIAYGDTQ